MSKLTITFIQIQRQLIQESNRVLINAWRDILHPIILVEELKVQLINHQYHNIPLNKVTESILTNRLTHRPMTAIL